MSLWCPSIQAGEGGTGEHRVLPVPVPGWSGEHQGLVLFPVPHSMMGSTVEPCPFPVSHPGLVPCIRCPVPGGNGLGPWSRCLPGLRPDPAGQYEALRSCAGCGEVVRGSGRSGAER